METQARADKRGAWGIDQVVSGTAMTIVGLVLAGAIGWFVLDALFWLLGWKGRVRPPRWEDVMRLKDCPSPYPGNYS